MLDGNQMTHDPFLVSHRKVVKLRAFYQLNSKSPCENGIGVGYVQHERKGKEKVIG